MRIWNGEIRGRKHSPTKPTEEPQGKTAAQPPADPPEEEPPEIKIQTVERLVLCFEGGDIDILNALKEAAKDHRRDVKTADALRRSIQAEAMCIMERGLQDRIWCIRKPPRREQPE
ncbi:MAG: hypothetical protein JRD89_20300 [Deltaproteobacteria bacterium]|nr:hypothetical protein [Deltaproteobacteria bacterium]